MTFDNSGYHRAVAAEMNRRERNEKDNEYYDKIGLDAILEEAFHYVQNGSTVNAGASILVARSYLQRHAKNPMQEAIEDFMQRCDQEVKKYPELPSEAVRTLRIRLMVEELLGTTTPPDGTQTTDYYLELLVKNKSDELVQSMLNGDLVGVADGLADVLYVVIGTAAAYGIDIQEVFNEVHRSNLSKTVWDDEKGRYVIEKDEFGKGLKPPTFSPANIAPIIQRQIENGKAWEDFYSDQASNSEIVFGEINA